MRSSLLLILLSVLITGCGHAYRGTLGPTLASGGRGGVEAGVELGTHLLSSRIVSMSMSVRAQTTVLDDGSVEGLLGLTGGLWTVPGGSIDRDDDDQAGFNVRLGSTIGGVLGNRVANGAARGALAIGYGRIRRTSSWSESCSGSEKSDPLLCFRWDRFHARTMGAELALTTVFDDPDQWRVTAAFAIEDVTVRHLSTR